MDVIISPFCHDGVGVHLTGFPAPYLSFDAGVLDELASCFPGAFAPITVVQFKKCMSHTFDSDIMAIKTN